MSAPSTLMQKYQTKSASDFGDASQRQATQNNVAAPGKPIAQGLMSKYKTLSPEQIQQINPSPPQMIGGGAQAPQGMGMGQRVLQRLAQGAQPINNLGDATARGAVQGTYSAMSSLVDSLPDVLNTAGGFAQGQGVPKMPKLTLNGQSLRSTIHSDPLSQLAFVVSDLGAQTLAGGGVEKGLSKVPGLAGRSLSKLATRGALTGAALSEDAPGGRLTGGVAGGIAGPLYNLMPKKVADSISDTRNAWAKQYNQHYDNWFDKVKDAGGDNLDAPILDLESLKPLTGSTKYLKSVKKFQVNPTFENAHKAQSDLGKLERGTSESAKSAKGGLSDAEHAGVAAAKKAQDAIEGAGLKRLVELKKPELVDEYLAIKKGYSRDVVPYLKPAIKSYSQGKLEPEDMLSALNSDQYFTPTAKKAHPDLMLYKKYGNQLPDLLKKALQGGAFTGGGVGVLKAYGSPFGGNGNDNDNSGVNP